MSGSDEFAREFTDAHEGIYDGRKYGDLVDVLAPSMQMDLHNNQVGIEIGTEILAQREAQMDDLIDRGSTPARFQVEQLLSDPPGSIDAMTDEAIVGGQAVWIENRR